jgi:hypothetical protein
MGDVGDKYFLGKLETPVGLIVIMMAMTLKIVSYILMIKTISIREDIAVDLDSCNGLRMN